MNGGDDKLAQLVADLQKAVICQELHRGRADRRRPAKVQPRHKAA